MTGLQGNPISEGIALAKCFVFEKPSLRICRSQSDSQRERNCLNEARKKVGDEIRELRSFVLEKEGENAAAVFDSHFLMLNDEIFTDLINSYINEGWNAAYAVQEAGNRLSARFKEMNQAYFRERAEDIRDVSFRLCCALCGREMPDLSRLKEEVILVAKALTPSDTARMDERYIKGIVTEEGGYTGHAAILARARGIPAVSGIADLLKTAKNGSWMLVDGSIGMVVFDPDEQEQQKARKKINLSFQEQVNFQEEKNRPSVTADGRKIELACNIASAFEAEDAFEKGADAIGLFRTEFLYMQNLPTETEQIEVYRFVLEKMKDRRVVIRTLDIGGDKSSGCLLFPQEENPFLGERAIRYCFRHEDVFRTQLRALLKASVYGRLAIMFPMIADMRELLKAKAILAEEKEKLSVEGCPVSAHIEIGMMVETPAAAMLADRFIKEVDFFSVGTNDLIQYTMAADRTNPNLNALYQPFHPAVLRMIARSASCAEENGKWCGVCGEMASDPAGALLLIGLGVTELSVPSSRLPALKHRVRTCSFEQLRRIAKHACDLDDCEAVSRYLTNELKGAGPEL